MMSFRTLVNWSIRQVIKQQQQHKLANNFTQTAAYCSKYYSKKKVIKPSAIPVTKANKHLVISLFDHDNNPIGLMPMEKAKDVATKKNLKLVSMSFARETMTTLFGCESDCCENYCFLN